MSATTFGHRGIEAVQHKDWATAISLLDKALESSNAPGWLLARAQAHQQLKNYDAALRDAELAYHVAAERGSGNSRKQMIEAQYRRSVVYHKLERYADADCCAKWSMLLAEGRPVGEDDGVQKKVDANGNYVVTYEDGVSDHKGQPGQPAQGASLSDRVFGVMSAQSAGTAKTGFESDWKRAYTWRSQVLGRLKSLPEDHPGRKVNVAKVPKKPQPKPEKKPGPERPESASDVEEELKSAKLVEPAPGSVPDEQLKLRVDFYQSSQNVSVSLFVKDVKKETLSVKFFKNKVEISPLPRPAAPYVKPGDREATSTFTLGGEIDPSKSRWSVTPRKLELVLQKATPGVKWGTWGSEEIGSVALADAGDEPSATPLAERAENKTAAPTASAPVPAAAAPPSTATGAPAYPTSSRSGPKNWDKLGDAEGDDDPQDVNYFFKQLYKGATPEQQRAMMKSFIESNGTALSTDWDDVKSRKVETVPPEGVEAKKWEA
ncbi:SGS domain-containing protein [Chaetomium strumarium]|uniref:SGS domain-containing protein n=1 Tax=Chaetomium strumarium TaxID=1170767 RepID=A0AAJ0GYI2_9PEZI|nr:SGS domain-containing protein [Chaetomium strumarium]